MKNIISATLCLLLSLSLGAQNQREHLNFDQGWQFAFGDASSPEKDFKCGTEYFIVEMDYSEEMPCMEAAKRSLENLKKLI